MDDLSTWYLRRSRDRIKDGDIGAKGTLYTVLKTVAKILAPFAPFTAEDVWQKLKNTSDEESVHLAKWPTVAAVDDAVLALMGQVREIATMGNAGRKKHRIAVRQPLQRIIVAREALADEYTKILKDELNIKEVVFVQPSEQMAEGQIELDVSLTPELKLEGHYRELLRALQDMRKAQGLSPSDSISLTISPEAKIFVEPFMEDCKKTVQARDIMFSENDGEAVNIDEKVLRVTINKHAHSTS